MRDDNDFNTKFCKIIQKHPALYDNNRPDYSNRNIQDQLWQEIGMKLNEAPQDCKDRWKNIRGRYSKYKKAQLQQSDSGKSVKEYYLAPHLHFIDQFLRPRKMKGGFRPKLQQLSSESDTEDNVGSGSTSPPPIEESFISGGPLQGRSPTLKDVNKSAFDYFNQKNHQAKSNSLDPDLAFLQSVLPDLKAMSSDQKRRFKIGVLNLAGQLLSENSPAASTPQQICERATNITVEKDIG